MPEIGPKHPITYRQEIAKPLFHRIQAGGSGVVVGAASAGKSRLLHFIGGDDVRSHYLGEAATETLLVWTDCNRMAEINEWGLYELMLTALAESVQPPTRDSLLALRHEVILSKNALLAQRNLEMAVRMLVHEEGLRLTFILDEFDECYRELPAQALANLRALRDMNKYALGYLLFMRDAPADLRPPTDGEGFYELLSRNILGLRPYTDADANGLIEQIMARRAHEMPHLPADTATQLLRLSGGHGGLLVALIDSLTKGLPVELQGGDGSNASWDSWSRELPTVHEECRKVWHGLRDEEQHTLNHLAQGLSTGVKERQSLLLKGLIEDEGEGNVRIFSPLLHAYVATSAVFTGQTLHVDTEARSVWIEGQPPVNLTPREFDLVAHLHEHGGDLRSNEEIIEAMYEGEQQFNINNNTVSALVRRLRQKIEPTPKQPRYLLNQHGHGYKLVCEASAIEEEA